MALIIKLLANGRTVAGESKAIYTVSAPALAAIVANVRLVNPSETGATVNIFIKIAGLTPVRLLDRNKAIAANDAYVVKPELTMGLGDSIEATTAPGIDYVVSGVEKH